MQTLGLRINIEILGHKTSRRNPEWYHFLSVPILANFLLLDQLLGGHGGRSAGGQRSQMFRVSGRARTVPKAPLWHPAQTVHGQGRLSDPYRLPLCLSNLLCRTYSTTITTTRRATLQGYAASTRPVTY